MKPNVTTQSICKTLWLISRYLGTGYFNKAAKKAWFTSLFGYLTKRLDRRMGDYRKYDAFRKLYWKYFCLPKGVERRYKATLWDAVHLIESSPKPPTDSLGCMYPDCVSRKRLAELRTANRRTGKLELSADDENFLRDWGSNIKLCPE